MRHRALRLVRASAAAVVMGVVACGGSSSDDPTAVPTEPALDQLLNDYKSSVVEIVTTGADGDGGGTGIVWDEGHQVLTNAHVRGGHDQSERPGRRGQSVLGSGRRPQRL
jgi:hypothetical protein